MNVEMFRIRGIGSEWGLTCFISGEKAELMPNISAFVENREAGQRVVDMFEGRAFLDYREREPHWIQVKVGCLPQYANFLDLLSNQVTCGLLTPEMIKTAKVREELVRLGEHDQSKNETIERLCPPGMAARIRDKSDPQWSGSLVRQIEQTVALLTELGGEDALVFQLKEMLKKHKRNYSSPSRV